jgi:hypothetical protein
MAKDKVTVTLDPAVVASTDQDATAEGMNRSEYVERVLRDAHYYRLLSRAAPDPLPDGNAAGLRSLLAWQQNPGAAA